MSIKPCKSIIDKAVLLAETWQNRANEMLTPFEKSLQNQMARLLSHPQDKIVLTRMIDQSFRSTSTARIADQANYLLSKYGVPDFFPAAEKLLMLFFMGIGRHLPQITIPKLVDKMREDSRRLIIPGEYQALHKHLQKRKEEGVRININHLGEAVLGEEEALSRLEAYIADLKNPEIECISVKISTIYSQIVPLAFDHTICILKERLSKLYNTANENCYTRQNGTREKKLVNLDMEEYRDLSITVEAFMATLNDPKFINLTAGIVLQAYLPDSLAIQKKLTEWAKQRLSKGGSPVRLRIVKGANLEMEKIDSALNDWPLAPYDNKPDVDANFKRMVEFAMASENANAVHIGIASHNLFELAYACRLAKENNVFDYFTFEMLEGMADHVCRVIVQSHGDLLLYAPVAKKQQFINAIAYLVRRLDENTGKENFLRYAPNLKVNSKEWYLLKDQFIASFDHKDKAGKLPHRIQNRRTEAFPEAIGALYEGDFQNEPDTDWSLEANRKWADQIRSKWKSKSGNAPEKIPIVVAGGEFYNNQNIRSSFDLSLPDKSVCIAEYTTAEAEDISKAVKSAKEDPDAWRDKTHIERHKTLSRVATEIRKSRADLIGAAGASTGKVFTETDPEVSEAIDFVEYYAFNAKQYHEMHNIKCIGKGAGLVISPWNFPVAIPCGGIAASLAAGNTIIFKPSSAAILPAWELCKCFWRAGISKTTLQFLPCDGAIMGQNMASNPDIDFIIFTGGTDTGLSILSKRPGIILAAETGGKNATIVTAMSDRDQAIKHIIHSAFSNGGQKCSATSLLILEKEVYEDNHFKRQLIDAAGSFSVGSVWDFQNRAGPLISPPEGKLKKALTTLETGESWALKPEISKENKRLCSPGIKWGVQSGSITHLTEFFGPILGVMCAKNLDHAIELANRTGYGLTSALESLDEREQDLWKSRIIAGNLYINRGTTGAKVLRQPFGGMKKSAIGAGMKTGGPGYVAQFMNIEETGKPLISPVQNDYPLLGIAREWQRMYDRNSLYQFKKDINKTISAIKSYLFNYEQEFSRTLDFFHLRGQDNILRYIPSSPLIIRIHENDTLFDILARIAAAKISGCAFEISIPPNLGNNRIDFLNSKSCREFIKNCKTVHQNENELTRMLPGIDRIRYAAPDRVPSALFQAAAKTGFYIAREPVLMEGKIELRHYFRQQSICNDYHRYGNLGERN